VITLSFNYLLWSSPAILHWTRLEPMPSWSVLAQQDLFHYWKGRCKVDEQPTRNAIHRNINDLDTREQLSQNAIHRKINDLDAREQWKRSTLTPALFNTNDYRWYLNYSTHIFIILLYQVWPGRLICSQLDYYYIYWICGYSYSMLWRLFYIVFLK